MLLDVPYKTRQSELKSELALPRTTAEEVADSHFLYETLAYIRRGQKFFQLKLFSATLYPAQTSCAVYLGYGHIGECVFSLITAHQ